LIGLFGFVIIVGVFVNISGRIPDVWEWVALLFAGLGAVFGLPSGLQRIYGKAKLLREYDRYIREEERGLIIFVKNPPLGNNWMLKTFEVRREAISSLSASFRISKGSEVIVPIMHSRIYSDDDPKDVGSWRIALPPTFSWSTSIMVAKWDNAKKKAILLGDREPVELSTGLYRMDIVYLLDGNPENEFKEFIVGKNADDLVWVRRFN